MYRIQNLQLKNVFMFSIMFEYLTSYLVENEWWDDKCHSFAISVKVIHSLWIDEIILFILLTFIHITCVYT